MSPVAVSVPPEPPLSRDLRFLAPKFGLAVAEALNRCWLAGLDPVVHEAVRSDARQRWLYGIGRGYTPTGYDPGATVTAVASALQGWHFYGLAVDLRSRSRGWDDEAFFAKCARHFEDCGLDWGGAWTHPDRPHFQWGTLRPSPSDRARALYRAGGLPAVWAEVRAA
jgi:peptidoglycan L-alanyl-D-glutamate endopeptidase CwlK